MVSKKKNQVKFVDQPLACRPRDRFPGDLLPKFDPGLCQPGVLARALARDGLSFQSYVVPRGIDFEKDLFEIFPQKRKLTGVKAVKSSALTVAFLQILVRKGSCGFGDQSGWMDAPTAVGSLVVTVRELSDATGYLPKEVSNWMWRNSINMIEPACEAGTKQLSGLFYARGAGKFSLWTGEIPFPAKKKPNRFLVDLVWKWVFRTRIQKMRPATCLPFGRKMTRPAKKKTAKIIAEERNGSCGHVFVPGQPLRVRTKDRFAGEQRVEFDQSLCQPSVLKAALSRKDPVEDVFPDESERWSLSKQGVIERVFEQETRHPESAARYVAAIFLIADKTLETIVAKGQTPKTNEEWQDVIGSVSFSGQELADELFGVSADAEPTTNWLRKNSINATCAAKFVDMADFSGLFYARKDPNDSREKRGRLLFSLWTDNSIEESAAKRRPPVRPHPNAGTMGIIRNLVLKRFSKNCRAPKETIDNVEQTARSLSRLIKEALKNSAIGKKRDANLFGAIKIFDHGVKMAAAKSRIGAVDLALCVLKDMLPARYNLTTTVTDAVEAGHPIECVSRALSVLNTELNDEAKNKTIADLTCRVLQRRR